MIQLETQEVGTGKWFPIIAYTPGTIKQRESAEGTAEMLHTMFGLYAIVTGTTTPATPKEGTPNGR